MIIALTLSACVFINTIGVNEVNDNSDNIKLYPNPTDGNFYIDASTNMVFQVFNALGELLYSEKLVYGKKQDFD
jgi:hypothetical protein